MENKDLNKKDSNFKYLRNNAFAVMTICAEPTEKINKVS